MTVAGDSDIQIERMIARLALDARENRLLDFDGQPIFDAPLVGVADGDDPVFEELRTAVDPRHLLPREILRRHASAGADLGCVRVIAWALPFADAIRRSNQVEGWPSRLYSLARNNGGALNYEVRRRLTEELRAGGWCAVAPVLTEDYDAFRSPKYTFSSTWSERHVAFAAGLGQFGLNGCLITPLGASVRLGSVVTDCPLPVTPRKAREHRAPCLVQHGDGCGRCIERCPVGAISRNGLDKAKCYQMRKDVRERWLDAYSRSLHLLPAPVTKSGRTTHGHSLGCALCQCGVPCEGCVPQTLSKRASKTCLT